MINPQTEDRMQVLVVHARERKCAIRLSHLAETMRPLPISTIVGAPPHVLGVAMIRGVATPVIDLGLALGESSPAAFTRFVTLKNGAHRIALAVDAVVGAHLLSAATLRALPAELRSLAGEKIESVGAIGDQLLFLVEPSRLVPEQLWAVEAA